MINGVLASLGFDAERLEEITDRSLEGECARVVRVDRNAVSALGESGTMRVETTPEADLVVGDWIVVNDGVATPLERRTELVRRVGPNGDERQSMAANVDLVLIVRALDATVRMNRLSTLLVVAYDSGATPVVVLTKSDVIENPDEVVREVSAGLGDVETFAISATTGAGLEDLRRRIADRTIVLLGESGAGKSTLTNLLFGQEQLATGEVKRDGQGRHTTTHRELVVIPSGGVVIDTPGIRAAASYGDGAGIELAFSDVTALATQCKFRDCSHESTPGCAITAALIAGTIDPARVEAYLYELREQAWLDRRLDQRSQSKGAKAPRSRRSAPPRD